MNKEEWRDIPEYKGLYQVSSHGQVRSLDRYVRCRNNKERFISGTVRKLFKDRAGYIGTVLSRGSKKKGCRVPRLVLTAFDRPPKQKETCNHKDGNKSNNRIGNLEWCTQKQNNWHKDNILGKHSRGEKNPNRKLTDRDVKGIRVHLKEGKLNQREIAEKFNVRQNTISRIKDGIIWEHLKYV